MELKTLLRFRSSCLVALLIFATTSLFAQRGPGGVSTETTGPQQSTCRIWLDASKLVTLADGDPVSSWEDASLSNKTEVATEPNNGLAPYFRDDPAYTMNGYPVVTFDDGRYFLMETSTDMNALEVTKTKTVFFAFRTSTDVQSRQNIYEEGGCYRGFNVYIKGGKVIVGASDFNTNPDNNNYNGNTDGDNTPVWGYTYTETPIQPNTTYVLTAQFSAPTEGVVTDSDPDFFIRGFLNGQPFSTGMTTDDSFVHSSFSSYLDPGLGTLHEHPNPIGIGAVNDDIITKENGSECNNTGDYPFRGLFAEFCYYNDLLNPTQRIIIENYLGAKYFANIIVNDRFEHQGSYGNDVIGIGRFSNVTTGPIGQQDAEHNLSKGYTPFTISKVNSYSSNDQFFLMGHNKESMSFTETDVPNDPSNTRRLRRIWRADETGNMGDISYTIDEDDLPSFPSGFSKPVLIIDETSQNFPNFNLSSTKVLGMVDNGDGTHTIEYDMPDDAFFTIGVIKPQISFANGSAFAIENDPEPDSSYFGTKIKAQLNFLPTYGDGMVTGDYYFSDGNATRADDYGYDDGVVNNGVHFAETDESFIDIYIKNDLLVEDLDSLFVILENGPNTTPGLTIGEPDTLVFFIYDNDPPPEAEFSESSISVSEDAGTASVTIVRSGSTDGISSVRVYRNGDGTADDGVDYSYNYTGPASNPDTYDTHVFADGQSEITFDIPIINDEIDEYNETINLSLQAQTNIAPGNNLSSTITIVDEDPEPIAQFLAASNEGFESTGEPRLYIELDRQSAKDVEVDYIVNGSSEAINGNDYLLTNPGTIIFEPMDTLGYPDLTVYNSDGSSNPDDPNYDPSEAESEDLILDLIGAVNATISGQTQHTYTILDFSPFQWQGAAGIGKPSDNIVWVDADRETGAHNDEFQNLSNYSPRNISVSQSNNSRRARLQTTSNLINNRQTFDFDGNDDYYQIEDDGVINLAGVAGKKSYFMVFRTGSNVNQRQVLYEQGAATRGIVIYQQDSRIYFHAWNLANDDGPSPWGSDNGGSSARYAYSSATLQPNTPYIVSCHWDWQAAEKMVVYLNGDKGPGIVDEDEDMGRIHAHSGDNALGGIQQNAIFHTSPYNMSSGAEFDGQIAEFIKFHEPQMNEARRTIIENYLSGKYNIALDDNDTRQIYDMAYAQKSNNGYYGNSIAGIGQYNNNNQVHIDAQGPSNQSQIRVQASLTSLAQQTYMIWGHNGVPMSDTWPYSSGNLPDGIFDRSGRVWKFFTGGQGTIGGVDLFINYSELANAPDFIEEDLKLLMHSNSTGQDFSNADVVEVSEFRSGYVALFEDVDIPSGAYITLGNSNSSMPLPIELLDFSARLNGDNSTVDLNWSTATETNNDHFIVERAGEDLRFEPILKVKGAGNSSTVQYYNDKDTDPETGTNYYRLKQVDFDGTYSYSNEQAVYVPGGTLSDDIFLYPNPYSNSGSIMLRHPESFSEGIKTVKILDTSGKIVYQNQFLTQSDVISFDPGDLTPGVYIVNFSNNQVEANNKLIVK